LLSLPPYSNSEAVSNASNHHIGCPERFKAPTDLYTKTIRKEAAAHSAGYLLGINDSL